MALRTQLSTRGQVRLLDFGVAKLLAEEAEPTDLTQRYGKVLTPDYASPELVRGEQVSAASDVYALGAVLYELLSGGAGPIISSAVARWRDSSTRSLLLR
jgi:eukaryotic-like serine/threonine-protein kinase